MNIKGIGLFCLLEWGLWGFQQSFDKKALDLEARKRYNESTCVDMWRRSTFPQHFCEQYRNLERVKI